jgi:hypothetical protein
MFVRLHVYRKISQVFAGMLAEQGTRAILIPPSLSSAAKFSQGFGQVYQGRSRIRMIRPNCFPFNVKGSPQHAFCLGMLAKSKVYIPEIRQGSRSGGMVRSSRSFQDLHSPAEIRFCIGVSLLFCRACTLIHEYLCLSGVRRAGPFSDCESTAKQLIRFVVST